jgi:TPR repeat protein
MKKITTLFYKKLFQKISFNLIKFKPSHQVRNYTSQSLLFEHESPKPIKKMTNKKIREKMEEFIKVQESLINLNTPESQYTLGVHYETGYGGVFKPHRKKALQLFKLSNTPDAKCKIANDYFSKGDFQQAVQLYKESKTAEAYFKLGLIYLKGYGVEENKLEAILMFQLSGTNAALNNIGLILENMGEIEKAVKILKDSNTPLSIYNLGLLYLNNPDAYGYKLAFETFEQSKTLEGLAQMGHFYFHGLYVEQNYEKAVELYKKSYSREGDYGLAICLELGLGIKKNLKEAIQIYKYLGTFEAYFRLGKKIL